MTMKETFDFQKFVFRTRLKQREVADKTGASPGLVGNWASGKAVPSYKNIARLIEIGMNAEELFGKELADKLAENQKHEASEPPTSSDLEAAVKQVLGRMISVPDVPKP